MQIVPRHDPYTIRVERHTYILASADATVLASVNDPELFEAFVLSLVGFAERHIIFDKAGVGTVYRRDTYRFIIPLDYNESITGEGEGSGTPENEQ